MTLGLRAVEKFSQPPSNQAKPKHQASLSSLFGVVSTFQKKYAVKDATTMFALRYMTKATVFIADEFD
jgi:hypothetical protein